MPCRAVLCGSLHLAFKCYALQCCAVPCCAVLCIGDMTQHKLSSNSAVHAASKREMICTGGDGG